MPAAELEVHSTMCVTLHNAPKHGGLKLLMLLTGSTIMIVGYHVGLYVPCLSDFSLGGPNTHLDLHCS